jgi:hypothetical protein
VYWLYDDNLNRVGLAEHNADNQAEYKALWFYENPFATLYQDQSWVSKNRTLWSMMSNDAYQDCLEDDFETVFDRCLTSKYRLVTPEFLIKPPTVYECTKCGKKSLKKLKNCTDVLETSYFIQNLLFVDDSFVLYEKSTDQQEPASYEQALKEQSQEQEKESVTHIHPVVSLPQAPHTNTQPEQMQESQTTPQFQTDQQPLHEN